jgi:hypothetical protein
MISDEVLVKKNDVLSRANQKKDGTRFKQFCIFQSKELNFEIRSCEGFAINSKFFNLKKSEENK